MSIQEQAFDEFYHASRRSLVQQTFALTGDLAAAQSAVRDAYIASWHHWRKVSAYDDPITWVRPRAWQLAQRRHTARLWQRTKGTSTEHKQILDAIAKLPVTQRKMLLLTLLALEPTAQATREVGLTQEAGERHLQSAVAGFAASLGVDSATVREHLASLEEVVGGVYFPRVSIIRRAGKKRRQSHTLIGAVTATVLAIASGAFVYQPQDVQASDTHLVRPVAPATVEEAEEPLPTAEQLLDRHQIERLGGPRQRWEVVETHDNTAGNGINTTCQQTRFADPDGISALVREFQTQTDPARSAVQTIEVSDSESQARKAFDTTVGWYAGCRVGRLQLLNAYRVENIGDEASVLMARVWKKPVTTYSFAVARIGRVITSTVGRTVGVRPPPAQQIAQSLADAVSMLCATSGAEDCARNPTYRRVPPPPSGDQPGFLSVADLPPVGRIDEPWVGTHSRRTRTNPSATVCDRADFAGAGARTARTRTFLIPEAGSLPNRFGLSETFGVFGSARAADRFMGTMRGRLADCEEDHLAADILGSDSIRAPRSGMEMTTWNLTTEVSESETVHFRLGFVRVGNVVAQVTFAPTSKNDVSGEDFTELIRRAGDRLRELG